MTSKTLLHFGFSLLAAAPAVAQSSTFLTFDGGSDEGFTGNAFFETAQGNPGGNARHFGSFFFNALRTGDVGGPVNPDLVGDYSGFSSATFSLDIKVDQLTNFFGNDISRPFGIQLIDRDIQGPNGSSGVYFELAALSNLNQPNWTRLSVTIDDTTSAVLPAGWVGFGDEDSVTFEPLLPQGATFASVLASVDEVHFTGAAPGFFFTNANFDVRIDNVSLALEGPSIGTKVCAGVPNSTGFPSDLTLFGSDVAADNALTIVVESLPLNSLGYFIHSESGGIVQNPGGSFGLLCIAGSPIGRFANDVLDSGAAGQVTFSPDLTALPTVNGPVPALAGETRYFQFWHRDSVGGSATSNFSTAESVTFS